MLPSKEINLNQIIEIMKAGGLKATKQRIALLKVLFADREMYLSLADLSKKMRQEFTKMSNETVYRNIKELENLQIVETRLFASGLRAKFQCDFKNTKHAHFICQQCGKTIEIEQPKINDINQKLTDYLILEEHFELIGICNNCR